MVVSWDFMGIYPAWMEHDHVEWENMGKLTISTGPFSIMYFQRLSSELLMNKQPQKKRDFVKKDPLQSR